MVQLQQQRNQEAVGLRGIKILLLTRVLRSNNHDETGPDVGENAFVQKRKPGLFSVVRDAAVISS